MWGGGGGGGEGILEAEGGKFEFHIKQIFVIKYFSTKTTSIAFLFEEDDNRETVREIKKLV